MPKISPLRALLFAIYKVANEEYSLGMTRISSRATGWRPPLHFAISLLVLFCTMSLTGCTGKQAGSMEHKIDINYQVKIDDPNIKRLTNVTQSVDIVAAGDFATGTYLVKNSLVSIPPDTKFQLKLKLPIDNPDVISTANATGTLSTNNQISFNTIPIPKVIDFEKGTVSGDVDLARSIGAFFINLIQVGSLSGDMKDMVNSIKIDRLTLELRPGSTMHLGEKSLHIGPNSQVQLVDAIFDADLNYVGTCKVDINFAKDCKWIGEKVDCEFDGGRMQSQFRAQKFPDRLVLSLPESVTAAENRPVVLQNCTLRFGKDKRSNAVANTCVGVVKEFTWQQVKGEEHPTLHLVSTMDMTGTDLHLKTDIHQTIGHFPGRVPGKLVANIKKDGRETDFETTGNAHAQTGKIIIEKKNTKLVLSLENVTVGPAVYEKEGALKFSLEGGVANIRELDWQAKSSQFCLKCGSGSTLTLPAEMLLAKPNSGGGTELNLPLKLKLGTATLKTGSQSIDLANLDGVILIDVNKEIQLKSDLSFGLQNLKILDGYNAKVTAKGLDLNVLDGRSKVLLKHCTILVPDEPLKDAIKKRIPSTVEFKLHKVIKEDKSWRYQNAVAENVKITNLIVSDMKAKGSSALAFTASGDVYLDGTVDKSGIIFHKDEYKTKPWNLSGHVQGEGIVKYKFAKKKGDSSDDDQLHYDLSMDVKIPDDVKLDWSEVAGGILKMAEKKVILGRLKKIDIPLKHEGDINVIDKEGSAWKNLALSQVVVKDAPNGGTQIEFQAETSSDSTQKAPAKDTSAPKEAAKKSTKITGLTQQAAKRSDAVKKTSSSTATMSAMSQELSEKSPKSSAATAKNSAKILKKSTSVD